MANYRIYSRTEKSKSESHSKNEDCFFCCEYSFLNDEKIKVIEIADGMGGLTNGEKASSDVIYSFNRAFQDALFQEYWTHIGEEFSITYHAELLKEIVCEAIQKANAYVCEEADRYVDTGTTISVVVISNGYAIVANVGDSPVYFYRAETDDLTLVSTLHTRAEQDVACGMYRRYSERYFENDHRIYRCIGRTSELPKEEISINIIEKLRDGDMFLAGSDGAFGRLKEEEITEIITKDKKSMVLKELFLKGRAQKNDDQTAILYQICEEVL